MQYLRLSVPTDRVAAVLDVLDDHPAVSELAHFAGASLKPHGDVITATVAREATNHVVDALRGLGLPHDGSIHVTPVPTWLSAAGLEADDLAPGSSADSVVWSEVVQQSYENTEFNWSYGTFMVLATVLAGIAIVLDSQILVIGAMVLGPEFAALAALGVALVRRRGSLFRRAAAALVGGFVLGIVVTTLAALAGRGLGWVTLEDVVGPRPQTAFIYTPDRWSFIVAVIAAAAGVLSLTSARIGGLSGVFISVTTIPAAANVSMGLAFGAWDEVVGSTLQLALNVSGMVVAGWATLAIQQSVWGRVSMTRARLLARRRERRTSRA